jgi:transposase InsO family protein
MRYEFIQAQEGQYAVKRMCRALRVSRSGYYAWRHRPLSAQAQANELLLGRIREEFQASRSTYGSPRIYAALRRKGAKCGRHRVVRLMRLHGMVAMRRRRRFPRTTQRDAQALAAPNLLRQDFSSPVPDRKWVSDITYIDTAEGWLYLAVVMDLFSRRVVGWAMADHTQTSLVQAAFEMALLQRQPDKGLLHHSDQGSQYTSETYQQILRSRQCLVSMSRVGNCYDNAAMESFFGTLKAECARERYATRAQARAAIFEYIEAWYNRKRLHSALDYTSPLEFELSSRH